MKINNVFYSIQGEGPNIGHPAIFIRLSGCNCNCGFCDSKYHEQIDENLNEQSILDLLIKNPECNRIIFTGGEPLLQQNKIAKFLINNWFFLHKKNIEFETNGTIKFEKDLKALMKNNLYNFHFNISPKLTSSGNNISIIYYQFKDIKTPHSVIFKFVYIQKHFFEILNYIKNVNMPKEKVYIMPEGATKNDQELLMNEVVEFCKKHGFKFSPRLHVLLWNTKKGV